MKFGQKLPNRYLGKVTKFQSHCFCRKKVTKNEGYKRLRSVSQVASKAEYLQDLNYLAQNLRGY